MNKFKGFLYGIVASSTFGFLPLFTLPVMGGGVNDIQHLKLSYAVCLDTCGCTDADWTCEFLQRILKN